MYDLTQLSMLIAVVKLVLRFAQRKIRKISNFACCVLRVKVISNLVTQNASRSVKRRRLNNTLEGNQYLCTFEFFASFLRLVAPK